jgi:F subunit of K+-transporting ATPase
MTALTGYIVAGVIAVIAALYLIFALVAPERF